MKALLEPIFLVAILIFCQSRLLFLQHVVKDCADNVFFIDSLDLTRGILIHTSAFIFNFKPKWKQIMCISKNCNYLHTDLFYDIL